MRLTAEDVQKNIEYLFEPKTPLTEDATLVSAANALINLVYHYAEHLNPKLLPSLKIDHIKVRLLISRFFRDAFGVTAYHDDVIARMESEGEISGETKNKLIRSLSLLSIRINSNDPRRTRIAAAFSLWMSVFRPIYFAPSLLGFSDGLSSFDAKANFYIASRYLRKYGDLTFGVNVDDLNMRLRRIRYDFTYRNITLSSLEFMYAGIFRPTVESEKMV